MLFGFRRPRASAAPMARQARAWICGAALLAGGLILLTPLRASLAADFTPEQRKAIEAIIHDYLIKNPDVLLDALQAAEDKIKGEARDKAAQALSTRRREIFEDPETPFAGNPNGDVSLVEFFDYRCPYCKQVEPALEALLGEDRQLRFVYKEFPVLGPESVTASKAALAARKQGKYDALHRALMALKGQINETAVLKTAESVGVDVERLKRDMAAPEIARALKANTELADALEIRGTPGFVIGNDIVPGAIDLASLKELIATARKK
jgi:protein-disulfide isomerase